MQRMCVYRSMLLAFPPLAVTCNKFVSVERAANLTVALLSSYGPGETRNMPLARERNLESDLEL